MAKQNFTPDRQITPDDDKPMKPCNDCNGCGDIVVFDEDDMPEPERCPSCNGSGEVEKDETDLEDEW